MRILNVVTKTHDAKSSVVILLTIYYQCKSRYWWRDSPMNVPRPIKRFIRRIWKTIRTLPSIIAVGLGLLFLGVWLHESHDHLTVLVAVFVSELGFAFLIAAIIFGIFEEWAAREHGKTAIGHIYGVYPAGRFFAKIEEHVLKQKFYRRGVVVTYAFKEQDGENILVHHSTRYTVTNVCSRDDYAEFPLKGRADLKPLHTANTKWDEDLGLKSLKIDGVPVPLARIKVTNDEASRTGSWEKRTKVRLAYKGSKEIEATQHVIKHDHDAAVWTSTFPSTDVELRITWEEPLRLKFAFSATHPELGTLTPEEGIRSRTVKLKTPFLKGHGIHFWWSPETDEDAPAPQPIAGPT